MVLILIMLSVRLRFPSSSNLVCNRIMPSAMNSSTPDPILWDPQGVSDIIMVVHPILWRKRYRRWIRNLISEDSDSAIENAVNESITSLLAPMSLILSRIRFRLLCIPGSLVVERSRM
ncbi:MAG: hypothetical protein QG670_16 [Thermoproteota archaeon]|nr:hypothetical protein [Thermoproteota archaeon]